MVSKNREDVGFFEPLTRREKVILTLLAQDKTNREIAEQESLALSSVKWYLHQIFGKLDVASREEAIRRAKELGLLEADHPGEAPVPAPRNNLPRQLTSLIGREQEIAQVLGLIRASALVTLTGSGGSGKTRLALQAAEIGLRDFPDGVWQVELAPLADPDQVPIAVASTLGISQVGQRTVVQQLCDFLEPRRALLLLDNCEHVIGSAAALAQELLQACPNLHILATSREILGVSGEHPFRCPSLSLPELKAALPLKDLLQSEAVHLFVERAQTVTSDFSLTEANSGFVVQICRRLDGMPLAIELAAARLRMLDLEQIAARLDDAFRLLTGGSRTVLPRHQTLRALISWSYDLLPEEECLLFQRLAVFAGGWSLEAAEVVCADLDGGLLYPAEILDLLGGLVNKSLVVMVQSVDKKPRYHMLETIRQYAQEKLVDSGGARQARERHLAYFLALAEKMAPELHHREPIDIYHLLDTDLENLRRSMDWALQTNLEAELRLASALWVYWLCHTRKNEGVDWLEKGLTQLEKYLTRVETIVVRPEVQAKALAVAGSLQTNLHKLDAAEVRMQESLHIYRRLGPIGKPGVALAYHWLGNIQAHRGDFTRAVEFTRKSLDLYREIDAPALFTDCLRWLGNYLWNTPGENRGEARRFMEESLAIRLKLDHAGSPSGNFTDLGLFALDELDLQTARNLQEKSLVLQERLGDWDSATLVLNRLGKVDQMEGNFVAAVEHHRKALYYQYEMAGSPIYTWETLFYSGEMNLTQGENFLARVQLNKALDCATKLDYRDGIGISCHFLAELDWFDGRYDQAGDGFTRADSELQLGKNLNWIHYTRVRRTGLFSIRGNDAEMDSMLKEAIGYYSQYLKWPDAALALDVLARISVRSCPERSVRLFGAAEKMNPYLHNLLPPAVRNARDASLAEVGSALGEERMAALRADGKAMSPDKAVKYALKLKRAFPSEEDKLEVITRVNDLGF